MMNVGIRNRDFSALSMHRIICEFFFHTISLLHRLPWIEWRAGSAGPESKQRPC